MVSTLNNMKVKELITQYQQVIVEDKAEYERQVKSNLQIIAHLDKLDPETEVCPSIWYDIYDLPPLAPLTRLDDNNTDFPSL
jgi:hypothetical protein